MTGTDAVVFDVGGTLLHANDPSTGVGTSAQLGACPPARRPDAVLPDVTALPV